MYSNMSKTSRRRRTTKSKKGKPRNMPYLDYRIHDNRFGGMPDSFQTVLEYCDVVKISSASSASAGYVFRGNSLYDPDYTSTGHQPRYFDQNMLIYSRYQVISANVTLRILGESAAFVILCPSTDPLTFTTGVAEYAELPRAKVVTVGGSYVVPSKNLSAAYTTQAVLGLTNTQLQDLSYSGEVSSSPASLWYFNIAIVGPVGSTSVSCHVHVTISYKCLFYDRLTITSSYKDMATIAAPLPTARVPVRVGAVRR